MNSLANPSNRNYSEEHINISFEDEELTLSEIVIDDNKRQSLQNKSDYFYSFDKSSINSDVDITLEDSATEAIELSKMKPEIFERMMENESDLSVNVSTKTEESASENSTIFHDALTDQSESSSDVKKDVENITDASKETKSSLDRLSEVLNVIDCNNSEKENYIKGSLEAIEQDINLQLIFNRDAEEPVSTLLFGLPGGGKSHLIKKVAKKHGFKWQIISTTQILDKYIGQSEKNLKKIMEEASKEGPTLLLMDEIDGLMSMRSDKSGEAEEARKGVKNLMLNIMSGSEVLPNLFLYFTTNYPWTLDRAFLDRLTDSAKVDLPDTREKYRFFLQKANKLDYECSMSLEEFSSLDTNNFNYRQTAKLLQKAARNLQIRTSRAPHLRKISSDPLKVLGCYCNGSCDRYNVPIMEIPSRNLRCGTITFSDVSEAQRLYRIRGNNNQDDHRKMDHFAEFGTPPKEEEKKSQYNNEKEASLIGSCHGHSQFEILGFLIFGAIAILFIYILVNYILK